MAEIYGLASKLSQAHLDFYAGYMERAQLTVKLALAIRKDQDLAEIEDKYDGSSNATIELEIEKVVAEKESVGLVMARLESALDELNDVREDLYELRDAADTSISVDFDQKIQNLNVQAGSAVLYPSNLIGNTGQGYWGKTTSIVDDGFASTIVQSSFMGTDYIITLDDDTILNPDHDDRTLNGGDLGAASFDDITNIVRTDDDIQFEYNTVTYNGTISRGGSSVLSGWLYNNFSAQTDIDDAQADVDAAITNMAETEREFRINLSLVKAVSNRLQFQSSELLKEFNTTAEEELDAKQAERRAVTARYDLSLNTMALTASVNTAYLLNMFNTEPMGGKQTVFSILSGN